MSVVSKLKSAIGLDEETTTRHYRCTECGSEFRSAKDQDRAMCTECMSHDVELIDE